MQKHVQNYFAAFGFDGFEFIPCEVCGKKAHDIHHVTPRSHFGSKNKDAQDDVSNLVALCRSCHDDAHGIHSREFKNSLKQIVLSRLSKD